MKKNLILSLIAGVLLTGLLSFTIIKRNHDKVRVHKPTVNVKAKKFACTSEVINLSNGTGGTSFTWDVKNGTPDHYNYGGYYQAGGTFSGTTTGKSASIAGKSGGGRFNVTPICADGSSGTAMNILF